MLVLPKSNSYHFQQLSTTQAWKLKQCKCWFCCEVTATTFHNHSSRQAKKSHLLLIGNIWVWVVRCIQSTGHKTRRYHCHKQTSEMDKGLLLVVFLCLPLISSVCEGSFTRMRSSSFSFLGRYRVGMSSRSFAFWRLGKTLICYGLSIPSVTSSDITS